MKNQCLQKQRLDKFLTPGEFNAVKEILNISVLHTTMLKTPSFFLTTTKKITLYTINFPLLLYAEEIITFDELITLFKMSRNSEDRVVRRTIMIHYATKYRHLCPNAILE